MKYKFLLLISFLLVGLCSVKAQNVVINEYSPDAGNWDSRGGEWYELRNTTGAAIDISCWRFTNGGNMKLTFPSGTIIPANGVLLVASKSKTLCTTCDFPSLDTQFPTNVSGVTGLFSGIGNYSNSLWLDLDACGCWAGIGALNNQPLGDRAVLFDNSIAIVDAVQFGGGNNYGTAAISVNIPAIGSCGVATVTVPEVGNTAYSSTTVCNDLTGCNSSYSRNTSNSWYVAANIVENDLDNCGGSATNAKGVDHPTPGLVNTVDVFDYTLTGSVTGTIVPTVTINATQNPNFNINTPISTLNYCTAENLTFTYNVFNYQNVQENATYTDAGKTKIGSFYRVNGGAATSFSSVSTTNGTTTLSQSVTPPLGSTTYEFVWSDENTDHCACPGGISPNTPNNFTSTAQECYVYRKVVVNRFQPLTSVSLTCNSTSGVSTTTVTPTTNIGTVTYVLKDNLGAIIASNNTGVFQFNTLPPNAPYTIEATNICGITVSASAPLCAAIPACPQINTSSVNGSTTGTVAICPGGNLNLFADGTNLPSGAQIEWYYNTSTPFDPYALQGTLLGSATFAAPTLVTCPQVTAVMIDAPAKHPTDPLFDTCATTSRPGISEGQNEFLMFKTGTLSISKSDISLRYGTTPGSAGVVFYSGAQDITNSPTGATAISNLNTMVGTCGTTTFVPAPDPIPANTKVLVVFANINFEYNLTSLCGTGPIYVVVSNKAVGSGFFGNSGTTKYITMNLASCASCQDTAKYTPPGTARNGYYATFSANGTNSILGVNTNPTSLTQLCASPNEAFAANAINFNTNPTFASTCVPPTSSLTVPFPATCNSAAQTFYVKGVIKPQNISGVTCLGSLTQTTTERQITVNPCPTFTVAASETCSPTSSQLTIVSNINVDAGYKLYISLSGIPVSGSPFTLGALTANTPVNVTTVSTSGNYDVVIEPALATSTVTYCQGSINTPLTVNINQTPAPSGTPAAKTLCSGETFDLSNFESDVTYSPSGTTEWYDAMSGGSLIAPKLVAPTATTSYYLQAKTDAPSNCTSSRTQFTVNVDPLPAPTAYTCSGSPQTLTITSTCTTCTQEYSLDGINWQTSNSFTEASPGAGGWGTASNKTVYVRNTSNTSCFKSYTEATSPCATPLPIRLGDFWGYKNKAVNVLKWYTLSEINTEKFEVQRSKDGQSFETIGTVDAHINSSSRQDYSFEDKNPLITGNYYRLKSVDIDGKTELSKTIFIRNSTKGIMIESIVPNPANSFATINISNAMNVENAVLSINDISGKLVMSKELTKELKQSLTLDVSNWAYGFYTISVKTSGEVFDVTKFVKF